MAVTKLLGKVDGRINKKVGFESFGNAELWFDGFDRAGV